MFFVSTLLLDDVYSLWVMCTWKCGGSWMGYIYLYVDRLWVVVRKL